MFYHFDNVFLELLKFVRFRFLDLEGEVASENNRALRNEFELIKVYKITQID